MKDINNIPSAQFVYLHRFFNVTRVTENYALHNLAFPVRFLLIFKAKRKIFYVFVNKIQTSRDFSNEIQMILDFRIVLKCFDHFDCNVTHDDPWYFLIGLIQCNFNSIRIVFDE